MSLERWSPCLLNILDRVVVTVVCNSSDRINRLPKKKGSVKYSGLKVLLTSTKPER